MKISFRSAVDRGGLLPPSVALLAAIVILTLSVLVQRWLASAVGAEIALEKANQGVLDEIRYGHVPTCEAEVSYVQSLPASVSLDKLVQSLQESSTAFGVTLQSVGGEPHANTPRTLATLDVTIAMHGAYPAVKSALAESLSRFPGSALHRLHLKREGTAAPIVEEASVQLVFVLRPQPAGPIACRVEPFVPGAALQK